MPPSHYHRLVNAVAYSPLAAMAGPSPHGVRQAMLRGRSRPQRAGTTRHQAFKFTTSPRRTTPADQPKFTPSSDARKLEAALRPLLLESGGRWALSTNGEGLERRFRFKTFTKTWVRTVWAVCVLRPFYAATIIIGYPELSAAPPPYPGPKAPTYRMLGNGIPPCSFHLPSSHVDPLGISRKKKPHSDAGYFIFT